MLKYASFLWDKISKFSSAAGDIKVSCHNPERYVFSMCTHTSVLLHSPDFS